MTASPPLPTPSITVVRTIGAPVAEVFAAWTDASMLRQWLAPDPCEVVEAAADARPGGSYRIVVADPTGNRHVPTLLTVDFRATGPGTTEITLHHEQLLTHEDREGNREGWRLCLDKLETLLAI